MRLTRHHHHGVQRVLLRHGSPLRADDEDLARAVPPAGADEAPGTDPLKPTPAAVDHPVHSGEHAVGGAPRALELRASRRGRHLQGLSCIRTLRGRDGHQRLLLSPDERQVSADGARDRVPDVPVAVDAHERFHEAVVAEHVSAAQGAFTAREALVAHRALLRVLRAAIFKEGHVETDRVLDEVTRFF